MAIVNIKVENDHDFYRQFQYATLESVPIDITGVSMVMMLRHHAKDEAAQLRLGTDTGEIVLTDPTNGKFTVRITQERLERLAFGEYDQSLVMTIASEKRGIWSGKFTVNPGPSR